MKTLLTIAAGCLLSVATMAAGRNPSVTIKSKRDFVIVVDGKRFHNDNNIRLHDMQRGMHTLKVYERSGGIFGSRLRLVSSKRFVVRNSNIRINIDRFGNVDLDEMRNGRGWEKDWRDNDWDNDRKKDKNRDRDRDRDYDRNRRY